MAANAAAADRAELTSLDDEARERSAAAFVVDLGVYQGTVALLLDLARKKKVDLLALSVVELADQCLAHLEEARAEELAVAAEAILAAAWLIYLKARLVAPPEPVADDEDDEAPEQGLAEQLEILEIVRAAAAALAQRPVLGVDRHPPGAAAGLDVVRDGPYAASLTGLFQAWGRVARRSRPKQMRYHCAQVYAVATALGRIRALLRAPVWAELAALLPPELGNEDLRRSALASSFVASLELARRGEIVLEQQQAFGPIRLRPADAAPRGR